jgi:subtilisin-like proprotein convertase family protein
MPAANYNFFIEQGSNFTIVFEYLDNLGAAQDLKDYCIRLRLKTDQNKYIAYSSNVLASDYSLTKPSNRKGIIEWFLPYSTTKDFDFDTAIYDLDINKTNTESVRLSTGIIQIVKNNFSEYCKDSTTGICADCQSITAADSEGNEGENPVTTPTVTQTVTITSSGPTNTPTNTSNNYASEDLCDYLCRDIDLFGKLYSYSTISVIPDNSSFTARIHVADTGIIRNVEVNIAKLKHSNPQDLVMILSPPTGSDILLSAYNKINNYNSASGVNFTFSNRAFPGTYLNNKTAIDPYVNILDKTSVYKSSDVLDSSFSGLSGISASGNWDLIVYDNDLGGSGTLDGWNLVLTYIPPIYQEEP